MPKDKDLLNSTDHAIQYVIEAIKELDEMVIEPIDLITSFNNLDNMAICMSNR